MDERKIDEVVTLIVLLLGIMEKEKHENYLAAACTVLDMMAAEIGMDRKVFALTVCNTIINREF